MTKSVANTTKFNFYTALISLPEVTQMQIYELTDTVKTIKARFQREVLPQIDQSIVFISGDCPACFVRVHSMNATEKAGGLAANRRVARCKLCDQYCLGIKMVSQHTAEVQEQVKHVSGCVYELLLNEETGFGDDVDELDDFYDDMLVRRNAIMEERAFNERERATRLVLEMQTIMSEMEDDDDDDSYGYVW